MALQKILSSLVISFLFLYFFLTVCNLHPSCFNKSDISRGTAVVLCSTSCVPFMILPSLSPTLILGQAGHFCPQQAPFMERYQSSQKPFIFLPSWETIQSLPLSLPDCLDKYLTDNLFFSLLYLAPLPIFFLLQSLRT